MMIEKLIPLTIILGLAMGGVVLAAKPPPIFIMVGDIGSGKSTIINTLLGSNVTESRFDLWSVTVKFSTHTSLDGKFRYGDTIGWGHNHFAVVAERNETGTTLSLLDFVRLVKVAPRIAGVVIFIKSTDGRINDNTMIAMKVLGDLLKDMEVPLMALFNSCQDQDCSTVKSVFSSYASMLAPLVGSVTPVYVEYTCVERKAWCIDAAKLRRDFAHFHATHAPVDLLFPPDVESYINGTDLTKALVAMKQYACMSLVEEVQALNRQLETFSSQLTNIQNEITQLHRNVPATAANSCVDRSTDCKDTVVLGNKRDIDTAAIAVVPVVGPVIAALASFLGGSPKTGQVMNVACMDKQLATFTMCLERVASRQAELDQQFATQKDNLMQQYQTQKTNIEAQIVELQAESESLAERQSKCIGIAPRK